VQGVVEKPANVKSAEDLLVWAAETYAPRVLFTTAFGAAGCALVAMIGERKLPIEIATLDTGLLFPETYALWRRLEARYGVAIRAIEPEHSVTEQAEAHGPRLWERSPDLCCELRKVRPLARALAGRDAWITSIRADETKDRAAAAPVENDARFGIVKINPLLSWSSDDVWRYVRAHGVPTSPLHAKGYPSIGCVPCTTPVAAGEDPRAGRWRGIAKTECGLHRRTAPASGKNEGGKMTQETNVTGNRTEPADGLVTPHGGVLVDRFVPPFEVERFLWHALTLPKIALTARETADLELIATGAASPLTGFLTSRDYEGVVAGGRLASGLVWPVPLTLAVDEENRAALADHAEAALVDATGRVWGTISVEDVYRRDNAREARLVFGTEDPSHPGVADLLERPSWLVGGDVRVLPLPDSLPFARYRLTPRRLREEIARNGWRTVAGFQTRNPIHRAHEHLTKLALELVDGLVLHPLVGETKGDDVPADVRFKVYETLLDGFYPKERTLLAAFPAAMRYAGPREALFHALVRKNYGITHFIVGRDHAGVGSFYPPLAAQQAFDAFTPEELGITPLRFDPAFWCRECLSLASAKTCPHPASSRLELSGSKVRALLSEGKDLPREFSRPETVAILKEFYAKNRGADFGGLPSPPARRVVRPARDPRGFVVWLTGLSGAGKSTLAAALRETLEGELPVSVLDGDEVRTSLCRDLGFTREDRETNVERIGFVARAVAKTGAAAVVAAISPYRASRDRVRALAEADGVAFLEVHVHAPLDVLSSRDPKGLYKKALAGEIARFTGVSDPYEEPEAPEVIVPSAAEGVDASLARILDALASRGLVALREERVA